MHHVFIILTLTCVSLSVASHTSETSEAIGIAIKFDMMMTTSMQPTLIYLEFHDFLVQRVGLVAQASLR